MQNNTFCMRRRGSIRGTNAVLQPSLKICFLNQMDKELSNSWLFYSESQWLCCTLWSQTLLSSCIAEAELPWKTQGQHYRWQKGITADFLEAAAVHCTAHLPFTSNLCPQPPKKTPYKFSLQDTLFVQFSHISTVTKMALLYLWMMHVHLCVQTNKTPKLTASPFFSPWEKTTGSHFTGLSPSLSYYL